MLKKAPAGNTGIAKVPNQFGGTCYANSVATVIRAVESRIAGRISQFHGVIVASILKKQPFCGLAGGNV